ncbi:MAG: guanylate kinase [Nitrospirae bacterium]|nr:guanylate kinase [Nitrospirota bacterium]
MKKRKNIIKGDIFIVSAPSGAGKTTLCRETIKKLPRLVHSVSYTTRPPRRGEKNGIDYFFVTKERFNRMRERGEFAEWAMVHGNLYGTSIRKLEELKSKGYDIILDIDVQGADQMRRVYKDAFLIFILPPSGIALKKRLRNRKSDSKAEISRRIEKARDEMSRYGDYDFIIINDNLHDALKELESIIISARLSLTRADNLKIEKLINK